ncbi:MAG: cyclic nucleotide-binding domain-containing protein [Acidobacteria bacterium]|nr:cyclic nucleotide-binding domain-containing protein [Acidobacteriota bacterium]
MFRRKMHTGAIQPAAVRFDIADSRTIALLVSELWSAKDASVVYAIDMLETVGRPDVLPASLLSHQSGNVRARALLALERSESADTESMLPIVRRLMTDSEADVRAAAVRALAALQQDSERSSLRPHLADPSPAVAAAAAVELADAGVADDESAAEAALARIIADPDDPAGRRHAAAALARIRNPAFRILLVPLIHDPDESVAREAIKSAGARGSVDALLVPALVSRLGHRTLKQPAREALAASGEAVVGVLTHVMADPHEHVWVRRHVPATLQAIPCQQSVDALVTALDDPDSFLRFKSVMAIERLQRAHPELQVPSGVIEARLLREAAHYCDRLTLRQNLIERDTESAGTLLVRALDDKLTCSLDRIFRLLGLRYSATEPAALAFEEVLEGSPMATTITATSRIATLSMTPNEFLALLSENVGLAGGLFRQAISSRGLGAGRTLVRGQRPSREGAATGELGAVDRLLVLQSSPLLAHATTAQLWSLSQIARQVTLAAGAEPVKSDTGPSMLFVLTGTLRVDQGGASAMAAAGDVIGVHETLAGTRIEATVTVVEPATLLKLDRDELFELLADHTDLLQGLFSKLVRQS